MEWKMSEYLGKYWKNNSKGVLDSQEFKNF